MESAEVLKILSNICPAFLDAWNDPQNVNLSEDGAYSRDGVLAEFSQFFVDNYANIEPQEVSRLFDWIEEIFDADVDSELIAGLRVCFLENISHTSAEGGSMEVMGPKTRLAFDKYL